MSNVDVQEIVVLARAIEHQKGKYVKSVLVALENRNTLDKETRKIILDGFNNFNRAILKLINYDVED